MKHFFLVLRILLALPMIVFGLNKFLHFMEMPPPAEGSTAAMFMGAMFGTYLAKAVALTEVVGGALLLWKKTSAFAAIILMPILLNILFFHLFVDGEMQGIVMGLVLTLIAGAILYFNKDRVAPIFGDDHAA